LIIGSFVGFTYGITSLFNENGLIQYNHIDSCGSHGVRVGGRNCQVLNNFVNYPVLIHNDQAGLYTGPANDQYDTHGIVFDGNIVLNSTGYTVACETPYPMAFGICLDYYTTGVIITNNTTSFNGLAGIQLNNADSCRIENNLSYANDSYQFNAINTKSAENNFKDDTVRYNIFIAKTDNYLSYLYDANTSLSPSNIGVFDYNVYANPYGDYKNASTIVRNFEGTGQVTSYLSNWQTYSGLDANSVRAPQRELDEEDIVFEYNASKSNKTVSITSPMVDMEGNRYTSDITLQPYTSIVLVPERNIWGEDEIFTSVGSTGTRRGVYFTALEGGTVDSIAFYHAGTSGNNVIVGIYSDSSGKPGTRLAVSATTAVETAEGWQKVALSTPLVVSRDSKYWITWVFQNNSGLRYASESGASAISGSGTWASGMPDPFGSSTVQDIKFSVYCTYD
jgi:hypothetical protein